MKRLRTLSSGGRPAESASSASSSVSSALPARNSDVSLSRLSTLEGRACEPWALGGGGRDSRDDEEQYGESERALCIWTEAASSSASELRRNSEKFLGTYLLGERGQKKPTQILYVCPNY